MEERSRGRAYEKLEGSVDSITFKSEDTGFTVLELNTGEEPVSYTHLPLPIYSFCKSLFKGV